MFDLQEQALSIWSILHIESLSLQNRFNWYFLSLLSISVLPRYGHAAEITHCDNSAMCNYPVIWWHSWLATPDFIFSSSRYVRNINQGHTWMVAHRAVLVLMQSGWFILFIIDNAITCYCVLFIIHPEKLTDKNV